MLDSGVGPPGRSKDEQLYSTRQWVRLRSNSGLDAAGKFAERLIFGTSPGCRHIVSVAYGRPAEFASSIKTGVSEEPALDRAGLSTDERRVGVGSFRGSQLEGLASSRHAGDAGACLFAAGTPPEAGQKQPGHYHASGVKSKCCSAPGPVCAATAEPHSPAVLDRT